MIMPEFTPSPAILPILHRYHLMRVTQTRLKRRAEWILKLKKIKARARRAQRQQLLHQTMSQRITWEAEKWKTEKKECGLPLLHIGASTLNYELKNNYKNF